MVDQCFADDEARSHILHKISRITQSELKTMCSMGASSVFQDRSSEAIRTFKWKSFLSEVQTHAPVLYQILMTCTKTKQPRANLVGVVGMCVAMLLKYRSDRMSLIHKIIGLILYMGHSGKQV